MSDPYEQNKEVEIDEENKVEIAKREETKNLAGPPVYYPPGHKGIFDESMHVSLLIYDNHDPEISMTLFSTDFDTQRKQTTRNGQVEAREGSGLQGKLQQF